MGSASVLKPWLDGFNRQLQVPSVWKNRTARQRNSWFHAWKTKDWVKAVEKCRVSDERVTEHWCQSVLPTEATQVSWLLDYTFNQRRDSENASQSRRAYDKESCWIKQFKAGDVDNRVRADWSYRGKVPQSRNQFLLKRSVEQRVVGYEHVRTLRSFGLLQIFEFRWS